MSKGSKQSHMNDERDDDTGQFQSKYRDQQFLDALAELGGVGGTTDVAEAVGCPQRTAYNRLSQLRDSGDIDSRDVGPSVVWMLADDD